MKVSLVQRGGHLLRAFDTDAAEVLETVFRREGVEVFTGSTLTGAARNRDGLKTVLFEHAGQSRSISASDILLALGREPNTASLNLAAAGVATDRGRVLVNERMQTSAPHIYAAGDCTGPHDIVHIAIQQGEVAAHNMATPAAPRRMDYRLLIEVVFTDPQVAFVGLTEKEANAREIPYRAARHPFCDHGKSLIMEAKDGFVKLLADPNSGEILGGGCVGPCGGRTDPRDRRGDGQANDRS